MLLRYVLEEVQRALACYWSLAAVERLHCYNEKKGLLPILIVG